jgi:homoserine kinase type II
MAVYTEVTDDDVAAFLKEYDLGEVVSMKGIAEGVENSNYLLSATTGTYILTLYEKRVKRADLPFFLGLMEHLADRGIRCPTPIHGRDGRALRELNGKPAAIVTFLQGMWPKRITPRHCTALGRAMAEMHAAGRDFPMRRDNDLSVDAWRPLMQACSDRADEVEPGLARELETEIGVLEQAWPGALPEGVIHADLFPDNVFFHQGEVSGFIDFYFACTDRLAYDLAICLNAWCFEADHEFNATKARALLQAYQQVRPFSEAELNALPTLARGAAMRFLLTRLFDWLNHPEGAYVAPKDPREYLRKLRFHREVRGPGAYGLA